MARYMVAEEFHGTKWFMVEVVRFLNGKVARDHDIPMVSLTAVNLPCRALVIIHF